MSDWTKLNITYAAPGGHRYREKGDNPPLNKWKSTNCENCNLGAFARRMLFLVPMTLLTAPLPLIAADTMTIAYPEQGAQLGRGWNSHDSEHTDATCITFKEFRSQDGHASKVSMQSVADSYSFGRQIGLSASASVNGLFSTASAKASFSQKLDFDHQHEQWAVYAVIDTGSQEVGVPENGVIEFTEEIKRILADQSMSDSQKMEKFTQFCGDSYVEGIKTGAELAALLKDVSTTRATDVSERMDLSYDSGSFANFSAQLDSEIQNKSKKQEMEMNFFRRGGSSDNTLPSGLSDHPLKELKKEINALPKAAEKPWKYKMTVKNYGDLLADFDLQNQAWHFSTAPYERIAREYAKWHSLFETVSEILKTTDPSTGFSDKYLLGRGISRSHLESLQGKAQSRMAFVRDTIAHNCIKAVKESKPCSFPKGTKAPDGALLPKSDLEELTSLPAPISPGDPTAAFLTKPELEPIVKALWVSPVKDDRCKLDPADSTYCWLDSEVDAALQAIPFDERADVFFMLRNNHDGKCLTVASDRSARLMTFPCNRATTQWFTYNPSERSRLFRVQQTITNNWRQEWNWRKFPDSTTVCLDVSRGTDVIGWPCEDATNMRFQLDPHPSSMRIKSVNGCLQVSNRDNPKQVVSHSCTTKSDQLWSIHAQKVMPVAN